MHQTTGAYGVEGSRSGHEIRVIIGEFLSTANNNVVQQDRVVVGGGVILDIIVGSR